MDTTYENRYVAFLDILGFKNMVLQSENNQFNKYGIELYS